MSDLKQHVHVTIEGDKLSVVSPYYADFAKRAKALGGKWSATGKRWVFDSRIEPEVRKALLSCYGEDGSGPVECVTVRFDISEYKHNAILDNLGRVLCQRSGRDSPVRLGDGVAIVQGGFPESGGSMKYPSISAREGTILQIFDVPRVLAEHAASSWKKGDGTLEVTIVTEPGTDKVEGDPTEDRTAIVAHAREALTRLTAEELDGLYKELLNIQAIV
jgi:hypothetical protein